MAARENLQWWQRPARMMRPVGGCVPLREVCLAVKARNVARVRALVARKTLRFTEERGCVRFRLPRLGEYELVVLEPRRR